MRCTSFSRLLLFCVSLLLTCRVAPAQGTQVSGVVTVAGTGAALEGARVTLLDPATRDTLRASVYTDAAGRYAVDGVSTSTESPDLPGPTAPALDVYPNPASPTWGPVTLRFAGPAGARPPAVELFDLFGRRMDPEGHMAGGVYVARLRFDDGTVTEGVKLVLQAGGRLDLRLERAEAVRRPFAGRATAGASFAGAALFVVERDGYATVEEERFVDPGGAGTHDFALTSYGLTLTRNERVATVDAVIAHLGTLAGRSLDEKNEALAQFLRARPGISDAGVSADRTVWALFSDGLPIVVVNNRPYTGGVVEAEPGGGAGKRSAMLDLPAGTRAFVMDIAGTGRGGPDRVATMLREAGYEVAGGGVLAGTIEDFRSVRSAAAVHISSHGAVMQTSGGGSAYGIGTSSSIRQFDYDRCTRMTCDDPYWEMYYKGELALGIYEEDTQQSNPRGHWAVTSKFVEKHWTFMPGGLLFLDACTSASDDAQVAAFRAPLYRANLAYFLGWDSTVDAGFAAKAASYFFDRVLGANSYEPETPPQRPFPYRDVWFHMITTRRASFAGASLIYKQPGNDPGLLLPTIERVTVFEPQNELWIHGSFGLNAGGTTRVTLGGQPLTILEWEPDGSEIKAELPSGGSGDVVVAAGTRESNAVPLTRWQPTFRFKGDVSAAYDLPDGTLTYTLTCNVPFRADVHVYRDEPGEDPQEQYATIGSGRDLSCTWTATGSGTNPAGYKYTLSGSGNVEWGLEMMKAFAFSGYVDLDGFMNGGRRGMQLTYGLPEVEAKLTVDPPVVDDPCGGPTDPDPYDTEATLEGFGGNVFLDVDTGYGIVAGRAAPAAGAAAKQAAGAAPTSVQCGVPAVPTLLQIAAPEVEWDAAPATNAPKSTTKA